MTNFLLTETLWYYSLVAVVFMAAAIAPIGMKRLDIAYGRQQVHDGKMTINTRLGWLIMESPASLLFLFFFLLGDNRSYTAFILLALWQLHYAHRSFIYPLRLKLRSGANLPLRVVVSGSFYCAINGSINGFAISTHTEHLTNKWLTDPRFIIGVALFLFGYWLNKYSDRQLIKLRENSTEGYQIPYGAGFRWVSMPNYLGEIITWTGFAIASWNLAALSFLLFTTGNLAPRAVAYHQWYKEKFPDYPADRKAIFPKVL